MHDFHYDEIMRDPITESQKSAATELIKFIEKAVDESTETSAREGQQIVFLSGPRGSGKSQILDMFHDAFRPESDRNRDEDGELTWRAIKGLTQKRDRPIFWLEPIDFDQLTSGANLTAALLTRLGESGRSAAQENLRYASRLDYVSEIDRARNELTSLQTKILLALEGNALERRPHVDQDTYAINALESERARPTIRGKLTNILTRLLPNSHGAFQPGMHGLYVVVIDDVDVRPMRAIMALQLAEFLSIPRLFFVFAGDFDTVDQTLFYQTQSEFLQMFGAGGSDELGRHDIENRANYIASSLLRKLVPPARRIMIEPMPASEGWETGWERRNSDSVTKECRSINSVTQGDCRWQTTVRRLLEEPKTTTLMHLGSEQVLHAPYRYVKDIFEILRDVEIPSDVDKKYGKSPEERLRERLWTQFTTIVDEDAQLGVVAQRKLKTKAKWSRQYLDVGDIVAHMVVATTHGVAVQCAGELWHVEVSTSIRRDLSYSVAEKTEWLSGSTAAMYMLAHDYHVGVGRAVRGTGVWHAGSRVALASTKTPERVIGWYCMTWPTYRQEQDFLQRWNEVVTERFGEGKQPDARGLGIAFCQAIWAAAAWPVAEAQDVEALLDTLKNLHDRANELRGLELEVYRQLAWMFEPSHGILAAQLERPTADMIRTARLKEVEARGLAQTVSP